MNGTIYMIKNSKNNRVYIGQTIQNVKRRFNQHLTLKSNCKNQAIYRAINKIGRENFNLEILVTGIQTYEELNKLEEFYISKYNSVVPNGYNLCPGGQKWRKKPEFTEEQEIQVIKQYEAGKSSREIANLYNCDKGSVLNALKKHGCQLRPKNLHLPNRSSKLTEEIMKELYLEKRMRIKDIAQLLNVGVSSVNRAKRRYNLERI